MSLPGPTEVGVIIGRFQVPNLHEGHKHLFEQVLARHKRVLVLLGVPAWKGGPRHPMDWQTRSLMIKELYPDAVVSYVKDTKTNEDWSRAVDETIGSLYPLERATLYGGRDGFTSFYCGRFPTVETLEDARYDKKSGTAVRNDIISLPLNSSDFRAGVIYGVHAQGSGLLQCVDAAIIKDMADRPQILLIRKSMEKSWRLPGGKLESGDVSMDEAVAREAREETSIEVGTPRYITSRGPIPDWRAERSGLTIHSALFYVPYIYGATKAGDDAADSSWFYLEEFCENLMEPCHKQFVPIIHEFVKKEQSNVG